MMSLRFSLTLIALSIAFPASGFADLENNFKKENLKVVAEGHEFTEGPTLDGDGNILFTSPKRSAIVRHLIKDGSNTIFYQGEDPVSALFFRNGKLHATQGDLDRVVEIKSPEDFVPVAETYELVGICFCKAKSQAASDRGEGRGPVASAPCSTA